MNAEVGSAHDFEVVRQAGVSYREIVVGRVGRLRQLIDIGRIRIVDDLAVAVVLHHDDEDVVKVGNAFGGGTLLGEQRARHCGG